MKRPSVMLVYSKSGQLLYVSNRLRRGERLVYALLAVSLVCSRGFVFATSPFTGFDTTAWRKAFSRKRTPVDANDSCVILKCAEPVYVEEILCFQINPPSKRHCASDVSCEYLGVGREVFARLRRWSRMLSA